MSQFYLVRTVTISNAGVVQKVLPGEFIDDQVINSAPYIAAGAELFSAADPYVLAAALLCAKAKSRGANEVELESIMAAGVEKSGSLNSPNVGAVEFVAIAATSLATAMTGAVPARRPGVIQSLRITMGQTACAAGESVVLNVKNNGVTILTGAITVDGTVTVKQMINDTALISLPTIAVGDQLTCDATYVPGATPAHPTLSVELKWS